MGNYTKLDKAEKELSDLKNSWLSMKKIKDYNYKSIGYYLYIFYYKIKGYEVEVLEDE